MVNYELNYIQTNNNNACVEVRAESLSSALSDGLIHIYTELTRETVSTAKNNEMF